LVAFEALSSITGFPATERRYSAPGLIGSSGMTTLIPNCVNCGRPTKQLASRSFECRLCGLTELGTRTHLQAQAQQQQQPQPKQDQEK